MNDIVKSDPNNNSLSAQAAPADPNFFEFDNSAIAGHLSVPTLSYKEPNTQIGFQILSEMYQGEPLEGQADQKPVTLIDVTNLVNGGRYNLVVGAVLGRTLESMAKDSGSYVGQCLALRNAGSKKSRTDRNVTLLDIVQLDISHPVCSLAEPSLIATKKAK